MGKKNRNKKKSNQEEEAVENSNSSTTNNVTHHKNNDNTIIVEEEYNDDEQFLDLNEESATPIIDFSPNNNTEVVQPTSIDTITTNTNTIGNTNNNNTGTHNTTAAFTIGDEDDSIINNNDSIITTTAGSRWKNPYDDDDIVPRPTTTFEQSEFFTTSSDPNNQMIEENNNTYFASAEDDEVNHRALEKRDSFLPIQQTSTTTTHRKYINPYDSDSEIHTSNNRTAAAVVVAHHSEEIHEEPIIDSTLSIPRNESVMNNSILSSTPNADVPEIDLHIETARQPTTNTLENRSFGLKIFDLFIAFFPFGFISFGGPVANVGLLEEQFVFSKRWISDKEFTELFALAQALPGTTSTQIIVSIGTLYLNSYLGGLIAFILYSLPSVSILTMAGYIASQVDIVAQLPLWAHKLINGFSCGALAIVMNAAWKLTNSAISPEAKLNVSTTLFKVLMIVACTCFLMVQQNWMLVVLMFSGALSTILYSYLETNLISHRMHERIPEEELRKLETLQSNPNAPNWKKLLKKYYLFISTFWKKPLPSRTTTTTDEAATDDETLSTTVNTQEEELDDQENAGHRIIINTNNMSSVGTPSSADLQHSFEEAMISEPPRGFFALKERVKKSVTKFFKKFGNDKPISGVIMLCSFCILFLALFIAKQFTKWKYLLLFEGFFRMGSTVFGGGTTVIPLIYNEFGIKHQLITEKQFLNGFSLITSLPGPLFNFSAFVGACIGGWQGALLAWMGLFLPGFFFIWGLLPLWRKYREHPMAQKVLAGINAAAIGFVYAAILLLWKSAVNTNVYATIAVLLSVCMHSVYLIPAPIAVFTGGIFRFLLFLIFQG